MPRARFRITRLEGLGEDEGDRLLWRLHVRPAEADGPPLTYTMSLPRGMVVSPSVGEVLECDPRLLSPA
jgi:hypothetical protein